MSISKISDKVGLEIKKLRKENKLTQAELAEAIGVSKSSIEKYETGRANPSPDVQSKLAKLFNIDEDFIIKIVAEEAAELYIEKCLKVTKPIYEAEISRLQDTIKTQESFIEALKEIIDYLKEDNQELKITINKLEETLEKR